MQKYSSMKKAIGIGLLLLANMVLLVHAVIPHHHHNHLFSSCEISFHRHEAVHHCQHLQGKSDISENFQDTPKKLSLEDCQLDNIYIRFVDENNLLETSEFHSDADVRFLLTLYSIENSIQIESDPPPLSFRQKPHSESLYTNYTSQSKGLRAPPYC